MTYNLPARKKAFDLFLIFMMPCLDMPAGEVHFFSRIYCGVWKIKINDTLPHFFAISEAYAICV